MKILAILPILCGISLLATSCATFPSNRVQEVSSSASATAKKTSLTYSITSASEMFEGNRQVAPPAANEQAARPLVAAATHSDRFSSVSSGKGGDVHLDVEMLNYGNGAVAMISGFISGFTFLTIPAVASDNYKVTATARSSSGKSKKYLIDDGVTTVIWLPMIFAMPFNSPTTVIPKVQENMYRDLIQKMAADGIIPK